MCEGLDAKYRFKCCRVLFCSSDCFRMHGDCSIVLENQSQKHLMRPIRRENFDLNLSEDEIISDDLLSNIASYPPLAGLLLDHDLRMVLVRIDNARDRRKAFSKIYGTSTKLKDLVDAVNGVLEVINQADNPN